MSASVKTISELGCGAECQQRKEVAELNTRYQQMLSEYSTAYQTYQTSPTDGNRAAVDNLRGQLDGILSRLTGIISQAQQAVDSQTNQANVLANNLAEKTASLNQLDSVYQNRKAMLMSREKQIEFAVRRARYSRMIMSILIVINVIILLFFIGLLYTRIRRPTAFTGIGTTIM